MNRLFSLLAFVFVIQIADAQELLYDTIDWDTDPEWTALDSSFTKKQEVVLKHETIIEMDYVEDYDNNLLEYFTIHKKIRVLGDDAIQGNNKVYISMSNVAELIEAKARVITPSGEVIDFDEDKILESEGGDGLMPHKYFAIDGAVKGSDIEYTYTVLRAPNYDGIRFDIQDEYIKMNVDFTVAAPKRLEFRFKSYNGFPEMKLDTVYTERNVYTAHSDLIELLEDEDYSAWYRNLQSVVYALDYDSYTRTKDLISFTEFTQNMFANYYGEITKKNKKALAKMISESGAKKAGSDEEKVRLLENYIKTNIGIISGVRFTTVSDVMTNHYTSPVGVWYITISALRMMDVKHELVITCDRYDDTFDEDFEHYAILNNIMIYFPKMKKYLAPDEEMYRLGIVPSEWTDQKGLFISEVGIGDVSAGLGKVKFIKPLETEKTQDNMTISVSFEEMDEPILDIRREMSGYSAVGFQAIHGFLDEDQKKELDESVMKFSDENGEILEYQVAGNSPEDVGVNPMVYTGKVRASSIIEKAGNKYLLKVGELIGPQAEMYEEDERHTDIVHDHNMIYNRTIKIEVPEGYEISGLDKLNINEQYPAENPTISFVSSYTQTGNIVEVTIVEQYNETHFDKSEIDDFRRIINAAANFNKVVLRLVKN